MYLMREQEKQFEIILRNFEKLVYVTAKKINFVILFKINTHEWNYLTRFFIPSNIANLYNC